jgi:hypothetical protein
MDFVPHDLGKPLFFQRKIARESDYNPEYCPKKSSSWFSDKKTFDSARSWFRKKPDSCAASLSQCQLQLARDFTRLAGTRHHSYTPRPGFSDPPVLSKEADA